MMRLDRCLAERTGLTRSESRKRIAAGRVTVCTQCAARRDLAQGDLIDGVRIAGAQSFVEETLQDGAQALVY